MSVSQYQRAVGTAQTQLAALKKALSQEAGKEAKKSKELAKIEGSITKRTTPTNLRTKQGKINRLRSEIANIQGRKAKLEKQVAAKTKLLHDNEQKLSKEKTRQERKAIRDRRIQVVRQYLAPELRDYEESKEKLESVTYDAFISHASEDKESFVEPLAELLAEMKCRVWYDDFELKVGDGLRRSIDKGLSNSEYGVVILSPAFFRKNWPQYELDGSTTKEMAGGKKVILPIWYNVERDDVMRYSLTLADKVALNSKNLSIEEVAEALGEVLFGITPETHPEEEEEAELASSIPGAVEHLDLYGQIRKLDVCC